jgi:hypothetical protein
MSESTIISINGKLYTVSKDTMPAVEILGLLGVTFDQYALFTRIDGKDIQIEPDALVPIRIHQRFEVLVRGGFGARGREFTPQGPGDEWKEAIQKLAILRSEGWMVAVHNDYRQHMSMENTCAIACGEARINPERESEIKQGEFFTFWLFTHPSGRFVKGEGRTDCEAVKKCYEQVKFMMRGG